jgi:hypothetical protein
MAEAGVISSRPADEARYGAEKDHDAGEPDTSSQELDTVARPKSEHAGPVRPVTGIKVCSGLCIIPEPAKDDGLALTWSDSGLLPTCRSSCRSYCFPWTTPL